MKKAGAYTSTTMPKRVHLASQLALSVIRRGRTVATSEAVVSFGRSRLYGVIATLGSQVSAETRGAPGAVLEQRTVELASSRMPPLPGIDDAEKEHDP